MTSGINLQDAADAAAAALTAERWPLADAIEHVPSVPGLYAIYGDETAWNDLQLTPDAATPLYIGKAEKSFVSRDLKDHFGVSPTGKPQTGSSTVRRSLSALLRDELRLQAVPRNLNKPADFSSYGLAEGGDAQLNEWMHARLSLAVWPSPLSLQMPLADVETELIRRFVPPINIAKNPSKLRRLREARALMSAEAARWRPGIG